jgi:hypothetical protein
MKSSNHPHLRILNLQGDGVSAVLNWLRLGNRAPRITKLVITLISGVDVKYFAAFMRTLGPSLAYLEMDVRLNNVVTSGSHWLLLNVADSNSIGRLIREVDLSHNTQLRALHFTSIRLGADDDTTWLPKIISQVTSPYMNDIVFHTEYYFQDFELLDWDALSDIFGKRLFASLQRVEFITKWAEMAESYIRRRLRHCDHRGILFVGPQRTCST